MGTGRCRSCRRCTSHWVARRARTRWKVAAGMGRPATYLGQPPRSGPPEAQKPGVSTASRRQLLRRRDKRLYVRGWNGGSGEMQNAKRGPPARATKRPRLCPGLGQRVDSARYSGFHVLLKAWMASESFFSMAAARALDLSRSFHTGLPEVWK